MLFGALDLDSTQCAVQEFVAEEEFTGLVTVQCFDEAALLGKMEEFAQYVKQKTVIKKPSATDDTDACKGFWMHKCVFPCVVERWSRVWVTLKEDKLQWNLPNSTQVQGTVPLNHVLELTQLSLLHTAAPRKFARNGMQLRLTDAVNPLVVALCGETMAATKDLVTKLRTKAKEAPAAENKSPSPVREVSPGQAQAPPEVASFHVWCCRSGFSKWTRSTWQLQSKHIVHYSDDAPAKYLFALGQVQDVALSSCTGVSPPQRFRSFGFVMHMSEGGSLFCCAESLHERNRVVAALKKAVLRLSIATQYSRSASQMSHAADATPMKNRIPGSTPAKSASKSVRRGHSADPHTDANDE